MGIRSENGEFEARHDINTNSYKVSNSTYTQLLATLTSWQALHCK